MLIFLLSPNTGDVFSAATSVLLPCSDRPLFLACLSGWGTGGSWRAEIVWVLHFPPQLGVSG